MDFNNRLPYYDSFRYGKLVFSIGFNDDGDSDDDDDEDDGYNDDDDDDAMM